VSSAAVYNARGALFATYARKDDPHAFPKLPEADNVRVDERDLVLFKRIVSDGEILGTVYLRADYELFPRVYDYLGIAAVVLIAAMLVALLMSSWMQNIVTRPILAIAQVAREGGRPARLFPPRREDERRRGGNAGRPLSTTC